ncbi:MAG: ABC transporter permease subunit [Candidatus Norongarragalinales archaeon]
MFGQVFAVLSRKAFKPVASKFSFEELESEQRLFPRLLSRVALLKLRHYSLLLGVALVAFLVFFIIHPNLPPRLPSVFAQPEAEQLPLLALASFARVVIALIVGLVYAFVFGYILATTRWRNILFPMIDVQENVPALGFFPAVVLLIINFFPRSFIGVELACILLLFTCITWNLVYAVFESIITIPRNLVVAADSMGLSGWLKFKRVYLPASVPPLVYNLVMSWTNAWFFLIACEIISLGGQTFQLQGIGSFLVNATAAGRLDLTFLGLGVLIALILLVDFFLWWPLQVWATRFRYEGVKTVAPSSAVYTAYMRVYRKWFSRSVPAFLNLRRLYKNAWLLLKEILDFIQKIVLPIQNFAKTTFGKPFAWIARAVFWALILFLGGGWFFLVIALLGLDAVNKPLPPEALALPLALGWTLVRVLVAFALSFAWTLPVTYWLWKNEKARRVVVPISEVIATVPATGLFPVIVFAVFSATQSSDLAAILLLMTGMQWYLFFNLLAGFASIPEDVLQAARGMGLRGTLYWKRVLLPAMAPHLVTGALTSVSSGWNTIIIAEYFVFGGHVYSVTSGLGKALNEAVYVTQSTTFLFYVLLTLIIAGIALNTFVWRPLYKKAENTYKFDL